MFSTQRLGIVLIGCACLAAHPLVARQQPTSALAKDAEGRFSMRVSTHLVQVNVIVTDKHGNPLSGLKREDFAILDNGKPQKIRTFDAQTNLPQANSRVALPPHTYTNRPEEQTTVPASITIILLDALNTEFADQTLAWDQVIRALRDINPGEYVALYWLGNGLHILHDFTTDASSLRQVLAEYAGKSGRVLNNSKVDDPSVTSPNPKMLPERQAFRLAFSERVANQSTRDRVRATVAALIAIADHVGSRKGRKSLVWVSSSFPISVGYDKYDLNWTNDTGDDFAADSRRAARVLSDADISIYPVDARGLLGSNITANEEDDADAHIGDPSDADTHLPTRSAPETFDTMQLLAQRTGGEAFYGSNNISGAIRRAMDDSRVTYTLGYYPAAVKWDGSFHEIKVKTNAAGARVRARSGYFALPDAPVSPAKNVRTLIAQLAASRLPATGIGLHVRSSATSNPPTLTVDVHLDLHEINMRQVNGRWTGTVESVFLQLDKAGRILKADDRTFYPDFDDSTYQRVLENGINDMRRLRIAPKAERLCIVVRDASTGDMGSIYLPLTEYLPGKN